MRKWFVPLTMLGLGSLGALLLSERGRRTVSWMFDRMDEAPDRIAEWNETVQSELEKIQQSLNDIAESIQTRPAL